MDPLDSRSVGPFRLVASLGRGGQADVFLAVRRGPAGFSKLIVLKSIRQEMEHDPKFRDMLLSEARLAARLQHPNVVQTLEVGDQDGHPYIAMEFLDGQPLHRVVKAAQRMRRSLPIPLVATILSDMLAGLHCAHELCDYDGRPLGVIHRDVSPQNVFLTYEGEVKIVDFGIAKAATTLEQTEVGVVKGKVSYMAPEQASGQPIDRRADLYAAGIVAWEIFAGRRAFPGEAPAADALAEPIPPLAKVAPGVPAAIAAVIDKALARERDQRFASAAEMRQALDAALEASGMRKAHREEIGGVVAELFDRDRRWLQAKIRESIAATEHDSPAEHTPTPLPNLAAGNDTPASSPATNPRAVAAPLRASRMRLLLALSAGVAVLGLGYLGYRLWSKPPAAAKPLVLRLCGSNTLGDELAPALVEAFSRRRGASNERRPGAVHQIPSALAVSVDAPGTASAFKDLADGQCDVGMASRMIRDDERAALMAKGLGDLRGPASEHVIALDGIAIIVHPNNKVRSLDLDQLDGIFSGAIKDWSKAGGAAGPIEVYARDEQSGTWETFKHAVLGAHTLPATAKRFADNVQLSDKVAGEPNSIGFIALPFVRSNRAVAISERGGRASLPSAFTVADESYPLSRRLYFYTLPRPVTPLATDLVSFVLSPEGQELIRHNGFIDLSIAVRNPEACDARCPPDYAAATRRARRLTLDFRFRPGTRDLDSRAVRDLDRLVGFLRASPASRLLLLGFATNMPQSLEGAGDVAAELERRGVKAEVVKGFGPAMPLSSGTDELGKQRNRRVEVWIR